MQSSPYHYQFTTNPSTISLLVHEVVPLQLLEIVNWSVPQNNGQVHLRRATHAQLTLGDLAQSRLCFAVPSITIKGNSFVVHLSESALAYFCSACLIILYSCLCLSFACNSHLEWCRHRPTGSFMCISKNLFGLDRATSNVQNNDGDTSDSGDEDPSSSANLAHLTAIQLCHSSCIGPADDLIWSCHHGLKDQLTLTSLYAGQ